MSRFKFIHVADIHLDSPLRGLEGYEGAPVEAIRQASRKALANLVSLAIEQQVQFIVLAGDLYDGDWKNFNTGLYFVAQMSRLKEAGIGVYFIAGNHDAANRMTKDLPLPDNVRRLSTSQCETVHLDDLGVAIHGQGFASAAVTADLSQAYCPAEPHLYNIGLLHTSAGGFEGHERYAPCTLDGLRGKGYQYWALGHIHKRQVLNKEDEPPIVFPGNIQGRHIRETGPKGCILVTVEHGETASLEFQPLDVFRWERCGVDASGAETGYELLDRFADQVRTLVESSEGLPLALRVELDGPCPAHEKLAAEPERWINELRGAAVEAGAGSVWVEKVKLQTRVPVDADEHWPADGPLGDLVALIDELGMQPEQAASLTEDLSELRRKLPPELREGSEALAWNNPEWMQSTLGQVRHLLTARMMAQRSKS